MVGARLSIDFGTSNTAAAYTTDDGSVHEIRLSSLSNLMPSAVCTDGDHIIVGTPAANMALFRPDAFEASPKRRLGETELSLGGRSHQVVDLIAAILRHVVAAATQVSGVQFDQVVLTHPDSWARFMKSRLMDAAVRAGLDPKKLRLVSEATAAAEFYTRTQRTWPTEARVCVFDLGAGTCDVAVLDKDQGGSFQVIASAGLNGLGGNDFDARLHQWVFDRLEASAPDLLHELGTPSNRLTLVDRIRNAKEALSSATTAAIPLPVGDRVLQITRTEFEALIYAEVTRTVELTTRVLKQAQDHDPRTVTAIFLAGGSSHIPLIHRQLSTVGDVDLLGDPKTVVVQGALFIERSATPPPPPSPDPPPDSVAALVRVPARSSVEADGHSQMLALGQSTLVTWTVRPGELVERHQDLFRAESDDGSLVFRSPVAGTLLRIDSPDGTRLVPGDYLALIGPPPPVQVNAEDLQAFPAAVQLIPRELPAPEPRRKRTPIILALVGLLVVTALVVGSLLLRNASKPDSGDETRSGVITTTPGTSPLPLANAPSDCDGLVASVERTSTHCDLLARIPEELVTATNVTCATVDFTRLGGTAYAGVECTPSSSTSYPWYTVSLYAYNTARDIEAVGWDLDNIGAPGAFPEPNSKDDWNNPAGVRQGTLYSGRSSSNRWSLCGTHPNELFVSCIYYDPSARTPQQVLDYWYDGRRL